MVRAVDITNLHRALLSLLFVITTASMISDSPPKSSQVSGGEADSLTCTVCAVGVEDRMLDVLTGVGHAVRVVRLRVASGCEITDEGVTISLTQLRLGTIIRVVYDPAEVPTAPEQGTARIIEILPIDRMDGER